MQRLIRMTAIFTTAACLAGCGFGGGYLFSRDITWTKIGLTQQQLDADWYRCQRENTDTENYVSPRMAKACMAARGYGYTESGI